MERDVNPIPIHKKHNPGNFNEKNNIFHNNKGLCKLKNNIFKVGSVIFFHMGSNLSIIENNSFVGNQAWCNFRIFIPIESSTIRY